MNKIKRIMLAGTFFFLLTAICGNGQNIKPLSIGNKAPDIEFQMVNSSYSTAHLSDFKGKLLILDFWATWCETCVAGFPKIDSLQKRYKDKLQVILVNSKSTRDTEKMVSDFFKKTKNKNGQAFELPSAVNDSVAQALFPHVELGLQAWMMFDNRVVAITGPKDVTAENIEAVLKGENAGMPLKIDPMINTVSYSGNNYVSIDSSLEQYSFFKAGRIEGVEAVNSPRMVTGPKGTVIRGRTMRNIPILEMYRTVIKNLDKDLNDERRTMLEVKDRAKLIVDDIVTEKERVYTYELVLPADEADSLNSYMLRDLNRYSGYFGRIEKRKIKCYSLVRTSKEDRLKTKGGLSESRFYEPQMLYISNLPMSIFARMLDRKEGMKFPVINETNYKGRIDIDLTVDFHDIVAVRKALQKYGLDLVESDRLMNVFALSDKQNSPTK